MRIDPTGATAVVGILSNNSKDSIQIQAENRQIVQATRVLNAAGKLGDSEVIFSLDKDSRRMIVKIVDRQTQEMLVEQIPPESLLRMAEDLSLPEESR